MRFLPDARLGEAAIIGNTTTPAGEVVGVQVGYIDPAGRKSTITPKRQLFLLEKEEAEQAGFRITAAEPADDAVPLAVCEGLEDALSIARSGAAEAVIGRPERTPTASCRTRASRNCGGWSLMPRPPS